ncbi:MAG: Ig-like domain-containing protein, partial [Oscillospiraceae bacterium]|nr:Ig-like domain-containing protein [Oscillospiraceae bacterium]
DFRNPDGSYAVEDLDRVQLQISALLEDGDEVADQVITTDIVIDTQAPVLDEENMDYFYSERTDARLLRFTVSDNYDIAAVVTLTRGGAAYEYIPVTTKEPGVDGETITITLDVSDYDEVFQIALCDYGTNERYYQISFGGEKNYSEDSFYAYRLFSAVPMDGNVYLTEAYNGWHSFETADEMLMHTSMLDEGETYTYAAEYVDGYIIGVDADNTIFAMKLGRWDRTDLGKLEAEMIMEFYPGGYEVGDYYTMNAEFPALDMAFDYTSNTLYVLTDESMYLGPNTGGHLLTLDWLTGEVTYIAKVTGLTDDHQALTLACDNEGVLYTVDAMNGDLYTLDKTTGVATFVGATGYVPVYQQTMAVDHATDKLYWAAYQDYLGVSALHEVDKTTGAFLSSTPTEYNSQLAGLFKPYDVDSSLIPDDAAVTGLSLKESKLTLRAGDVSTLHPMAQPYYAELDAEEITWTSSDPAVVTVENGVVTAVGRGEATVTAELNGLQVTCAVEVIALSGDLYVYDFGTDYSASYTWLTVDVNEPGKASTLPGAMALPNGVTAAAYVDGSIYAYDSNGGFWKYDADTMQAQQISTGDGTAVIAMAMNYADGYMYAIRYDGTSSFSLCQVNLHTGELRSVMDYLESMYGTPLGGMAIDYTGRFYFMNLDSSGALRLDSYKLSFDGWMYMTEGYVSATLPGLNCYSFSSLVWSEKNDGLFWANDQAQLYWIGAEVSSNYVVDEWGWGYEEVTMDAGAVLLGTVGNTLSPSTGMAMNMGLLEIPENEPALPEVPLQSATMPASITVPAGGSTSSELAVEPWNARYTVSYEMADESIATVDASGTIYGVNPGETTLTATIYNADGTVFQTLTAEIKSVFSDVDLYMFLITDFMAGGDAWLRVNGANSTTSVAANYDFTVYAAGYYDGKIYAVAAAEDYGYKNHLMRINADTFVVEEVYPAELSFDIRDMAFDYTTGTMYAVAQGGTVTGAVAQINLTTGEATVVADSGTELVAMSCDAAGQLYVISADGNLNKVDKYTATLEYVGYMGGVVSGYQGMHYDHDSGNTYWANQLGIYLLDLEACTKTGVGYAGGAVGSLLTMPKSEPEAPATTPVTGVSLRERAAVVKGDTLQLTATVLPVSVSEVDQTVTWGTSDPSIATVDENGLVTGLTDGTVTITATAGGYTDECVVTVLAEAQKFYAYNETAKSWVQINTETGELTTVKAEAGLSPITAATGAGEAIYAFDDDGYFYSIDPATFERTKLGDGINGMTQDCCDGWSYYTTEVDITDLSYDAESGRLFGLVSGLYEDYDVGLYLVYNAIVEVNLTEGRLNPYTWETMDVGDVLFIQTYDGSNGIYRPGNLLVKDGYAYSVDTWYSGILSRVSLTWDPWMESWYAGSVEQLAHVNQLEWGMFFESRSLVYDPVFDVTYTIHDLGLDDNGNPRSKVTLNTINLGNAATAEVCELGSGIVIHSLIIR